MMQNQNRPAIFFDRDGVLNHDGHLITKISQIEIFKDAANVIATARDKGYMTFIVTNQAVVARGLASEEDIKNVNQHVANELKKLNPNALFDEIYMCPYHPNADVESYRVDSEDRKPKPGMLLKAKEKYNINMKDSFMLGDRPTDIVAGKLAGTKTVLIKSGKHNDKKIVSTLSYNKELETPDYQIQTISEFEKILGNANV